MILRGFKLVNVSVLDSQGGDVGRGRREGGGLLVSKQKKKTTTVIINEKK